jgi:hypothetical protein
MSLLLKIVVEKVYGSFLSSVADSNVSFFPISKLARDLYMESRKSQSSSSMSFFSKSPYTTTHGSALLLCRAVGQFKSSGKSRDGFGSGAERPLMSQRVFGLAKNGHSR